MRFDSLVNQMGSCRAHSEVKEGKTVLQHILLPDMTTALLESAGENEQRTL